jgi:acetyl esterase/lipase
MEKTNIEKINAIKSFLKQSNNHEEKSVEQIRQDLSVTASKLPKIPDITVEKVNIEYLSGEWVKADNAAEDKEKVILYFHGGGFISGSCDTYRDLVSRISKASGVQVLTIDYRLAPEYQYPAANDDCLLAYKWLLGNGYSAGNIILGGDSVGGSLVLMTLLSIRDTGLQLPKAAFLLSPHTDLINLEGESYTNRAELDPMVTLKGTQHMLDQYLGSIKEKPLILSPLRYGLKGIPSLFIQVGDHEVLLSDSMRLSQNAKEAGVDVTLEVWENMWHVFQSMAFMLPEAQQAIDNIGQFVKIQFKISYIG